ncbi:MAG: hypothetical protein KUF79_17365 [Candidatus Thiodiazotropha sp. (ex Ctena orbiculata)]|nr:hypothetical protein [Candidatus Thiodiazotropha taylori]
MNIQRYVDQLDAAAPSLQQVIVANPGVRPLAVSTDTELYNVLRPLLNDQAFHMVLPEEPVYPNLVFQLISSQPQVVDGYHVSQIDTFLLFVRAETIEVLNTSVDEVLLALDASSWSMEVNDMMYDYDDEQLVFRANIEVIFTVTALPDPALLPAAVVYPANTSADPTPYGNFVRQLEHQSFVVVLMSNGASIESLRREVQDALLGFQVGDSFNPVQYQQGTALDGGGGLQLWQEVYGDGHYIEQL